MKELIDSINILNKRQRRTLLNAILTPLSWLYGALVWLRNMAFNCGILKQERFDMPVVSVGSITMGGTGKTPHVEYLIEALCHRYKIGVLSRGYKRNTHGFVLVTDSLSPIDIGDEPYQLYRKFNGLITLAVCEKRNKGIREMLRIEPSINLFILDDAFQHRSVKPKVNIVLVDYSRPPFDDKLLPLGQLREPVGRLVHCDMVVVTKCPSNLSPVDIRAMKANLNLFRYQNLFFSNISYADPVPVFPVPNPQLSSLTWLRPEDTLLCLTCIADVRPLVRYLRQFPARVKVMHFKDHHYFSRKDFINIFGKFNELESQRKYIITTERDMVRFLYNPYYPPTRRDIIFYIPIWVGILENERQGFIPSLVKKIEEVDSNDYG